MMGSYVEGMNMPNATELRKQMAATCRRMDELQFAAGSAGNVSVRAGRNAILITPAGKALGGLNSRDFVRVSFDGSRRPRGRPSTELSVHVLVYRSRADVGAVIHAHPPALVGFAMARKDFGKPCNMEVYAVMGEPVLVPFAPVGESGPVLEPLLHRADCFLLSNHGALTLGATLEEARHRMEILEYFARALLAARMLGGPVSFTAAELKRIESFMKRVDLPMPRSVAVRKKRRRSRARGRSQQGGERTSGEQ